MNHELIWGQITTDGEDFIVSQEYNIVTNLTCPKCDSCFGIFTETSF